MLHRHPLLSWCGLGWHRFLQQLELTDGDEKTISTARAPAGRTARRKSERVPAGDDPSAPPDQNHPRRAERPHRHADLAARRSGGGGLRAGAAGRRAQTALGRPAPSRLAGQRQESAAPSRSSAAIDRVQPLPCPRGHRRIVRHHFQQHRARARYVPFEVPTTSASRSRKSGRRGSSASARSIAVRASGSCPIDMWA